MDEDKIKAIAEAVAKIKAEKDAVAKSEAEQVAKDEKLKELEEKIAKLEAKPVDKKDSTTFSVGKPDLYKGYRFKAQFDMERTYAPTDEKEKEAVVKEMLDLFGKYKETGIINKASMQVGTDTEGGYLVPETWANVVQDKARLISVALQDCQRFPIINGAMHIPKTATNVSVTWAAEEAASTESEPTVGEISLTAKRVGLWGSMSQELLDDAAYDVVGYITRSCVEALGQEIDSQVFNGTEMTGLLPSVTTNNIIFGASNTGTSYTDMVAKNWMDAIFKIAAVRRMGAKFYLPKELLPTLQGLTTGTAGTPLMSYLGGAQTASIGGYGFKEVEAISGTDTTAAQDFVLFGNLKNYALGIKLLPSTIELNPWAGTQFKQNQVLFRMYARMNGAPIFEDLFSLISTAAD